MASYLINKKHKDDSILKFDGIEGYTFHPKSKETYLKVNEVKIVDKKMIDKILTMKYEKTFQKLVKLAMSVIDDEEASSEAASIVMDEVELVREILLNKYQKFLSQEKEELFLKKLRVIENEMRLKQVRIVAKYNYLQEQERAIGRSR